ncbi:MAG: molecular chaperone DnaJ [Ruminococcaceae bacterium]|nr:molecular chaperone DnaJ [Oscillospiraceae bacterium]
MERDPYDILGISRYSTEEDIKKAYRELAKKYHPDNFSDDSMRRLAEEKMKEINEAYNTVMRGAQNAYSSGGSSYAASEFILIRQMINEHNFSEAEVKLDAMNASDRGAEWHFLKGCLMTQKGWFLDANKYFETACNMDPSNMEYRQALESMKNTANSYSKGYRHTPTSRNTECCDMDCCTQLICADCLCECLGGDFISCC